MVSAKSHNSHPFLFFPDLPSVERCKYFSWLGLQYKCRGMPFKQHVEATVGREVDEGGSASATLGCVVLKGTGSLNGDHRAGSSPEGMEALILPVLHGVGISAGALIPYVTGHGEGNYLRGRKINYMFKTYNTNNF